jgi:hypothetical protein
MGNQGANVVPAHPKKWNYWIRNPPMVYALDSLLLFYFLCFQRPDQLDRCEGYFCFRRLPFHFHIPVLKSIPGLTIFSRSSDIASIVGYSDLIVASP